MCCLRAQNSPPRPYSDPPVTPVSTSGYISGMSGVSVPGSPGIFNSASSSELRTPRVGLLFVNFASISAATSPVDIVRENSRNSVIFRDCGIFLDDVYRVHIDVVVAHTHFYFL